MAELAEIQSKQPAEIKPLSVTFADALSEGEALSGVEIVVYEWDDRDQVTEELDLESDFAGADEVKITLFAANVELGSVTKSLAATLTTLLIQAVNDNAWETVEGMIPEGSIGWDTDTVTFNLAGGTAGHRYKITVSVTTDASHAFEQDILVTVENL
jgi:hypothetical protein